MDTQTISATSKGPINIAVIKYWGKENEEEIIPLNNSISVTLDTNKFYTETNAKLILNNKNENTLYLNDEEEKISKRVLKIINYFRNNCNNTAFSSGELIITSFNSFPTAAGCASSASSMSCLVKVLSKVFLSDTLSNQELSRLARLGSGSACRSIYGGFVEWEKYNTEFKDSIAVQLANESHWEDIRIMLIIVSDKRKDTSSTDGMKTSVLTSELLKCRVNTILPKRLEEMREAIYSKDFDKLCELTIKDSNNFHAVCRDTFPTICYMNDTSNLIVKCVEKINFYFKKFVCAYTFDAGPNAFLIFKKENSLLLEKIFKFVFDDNLWEDDKVESYFGELNLNEDFVKIIREMRSYKERINAKIQGLEIFNIGSGVI